jgi:hypothetical protein
MLFNQASQVWDLALILKGMFGFVDDNFGSNFNFSIFLTN